jgi:hypothetical protein
VDCLGDSKQLTVLADCDGVTSVEVVGSENPITWVERARRRAPRFESLGSNNRILAVPP